MPAAVVDPVVVTFDGQYVWSFSPRRDGVRTPRRLAGAVAGGDARPARRHHLRAARRPVAERVHFEGRSPSGAATTQLAFRDAPRPPARGRQGGHLTRVFSETDDDVRRQIVEGTARAIADLRDDVGIDAHVSYGCLLGAVRDGRMIGHDSDADLAYLSRHTHPADIVRESFRMERELRALGWKVVRMSGADLKLFLPLPDGRVVHVDVFGAFHVEGTFYQLGGRSGQLAARGADPRLDGDPRGRRAGRAGRPGARCSSSSTAPSWRVPDPAFSNVDPLAGLRRHRRLDARRAHRRDRLERALPQPTRPRSRGSGSAFAEWVANRMPGDATVVDLGCGTGRDSGWFARQGHRVIALRLLRRRAAPDHARGWTAGASQSPDVRVLLLNDLRAALLAGAELAREPEPPYLYARGLVGCLDAEARAQPVAAVLDVAAPRRLAVPASTPPRDPDLPRDAARRPGHAGSSTASLVREITAAAAGSSTARRARATTSSTSPTPTSPASRSAGTPSAPTSRTATPQEERR